MATHETRNSRYCRQHYVYAMRRSMDLDQRIFLKAEFKESLKDGPHKNAQIKARLNKVDSVYFLKLMHSGSKDGNKSMTFQNLSSEDLQRLSGFFREMSDYIDDHV